MNKRKKEIFKIVGVSALCIGVFSVSFVGINSGVFAISANKVTEISSSVVAAENMYTEEDINTIDLEQIPEENAQEEAEATTEVTSIEAMQQTVTPREGFIEPTISMYVPEGFEGCENALSPEEAALIGAQYIWEIFGESIDGDFIWLVYWDFPSHTRTFWYGTVADSKEDIQSQTQRSFGFAIDGITGEWIDVSNFRAFRDSVTAEAQDKFNELSMTDEGWVQINEAWDAIDNEIQRNPNQLDMYIETVIEYTGRHFSNTGIISVDFVSIRASVLDLDENGNFIPRANVLRFTVTDNTGRVANVFLDEETRAVTMISTMDNDVFPGFGIDIIE